MKLGKNFSLHEFTRSQTASRRNIDNTPDPVIVKRLEALVDNVLQPVRDHFGRPVRISSGYRSPRLNRAIGGSRTSQHMQGEAADFEIPGLSNYEVAKWMKQNLNYDQLILEFYTPGVPNSGWIHVSYGPRMRNQELTAARIRGRTRYMQGLVQ